MLCLALLRVEQQQFCVATPINASRLRVSGQFLLLHAQYVKRVAEAGNFVLPAWCSNDKHMTLSGQDWPET